MKNAPCDLQITECIITPTDLFNIENIIYYFASLKELHVSMEHCALNIQCCENNWLRQKWKAYMCVRENVKRKLLIRWSIPDDVIDFVVFVEKKRFFTIERLVLLYGIRTVSHVVNVVILWDWFLYITLFKAFIIMIISITHLLLVIYFVILSWLYRNCTYVIFIYTEHLYPTANRERYGISYCLLCLSEINSMRLSFNFFKPEKCLSFNVFAPEKS